MAIKRQNMAFETNPQGLQNLINTVRCLYLHVAVAVIFAGR